MEKRFITPEEAIGLLKEGEEIHTFRNPSGLLIGYDLGRDFIIDLLNTYPDKIEIGGETCRNLEHGIVLKDGSGLLFIETDMEKLNLFDPI